MENLVSLVAKSCKMIENSDLVNTAYRDAISYHANQYRKYSDVPYVIHCLDVVRQLARWDIKKDKYPKIWASALLHDIVEDCGISVETIKNKYPECADWIILLSRLPTIDKQMYLDNFIHKPIEVVIIKLADRCCNIHDFIHDAGQEKAKKYKMQAENLIGLIEKRRSEIINIFGLSTLVLIEKSFLKLEHDIEYSLI